MITLHPLINPNSSHYDTQEKTAIEHLEDQLTVREMIGFCKGNIYKYTYRKEHKGAKEADEEKIKTYVNYMAVLHSTLNASIGGLTVTETFKHSGISFRYR